VVYISKLGVENMGRVVSHERLLSAKSGHSNSMQNIPIYALILKPKDWGYK
jgi:hypothetical protein